MGGGDDVRPIEKVFKGNDGSVTLTIGPKKAAPERSYPSNWAELSKVDKLKWLTANK